MNYRVNDDQFLGYHVEEEEEETRKGPWTEKEDSILIDYINSHGQGRWNFIARNAGLKRSGKSCRLRWLNYLRPGIKRENFTLQEQLTILKLHFRWGNRWSKIAELLPGRTDNDIKNYWRTRVKKQAKQLKMDVNSKQFQDAMRYVWIPRLEDQIIGATSHDNDRFVNSASTSTITGHSRDISLILPSNNKGTLTISSEVAVSSSTDSVQLADYYVHKENSNNCFQYFPSDEILAPQIPLLIHNQTNNSTLVDQLHQDFLILGDLWNHSSSC